MVASVIMHGKVKFPQPGGFNRKPFLISASYKTFSPFPDDELLMKSLSYVTYIALVTAFTFQIN